MAMREENPFILPSDNKGPRYEPRPLEDSPLPEPAGVSSPIPVQSTPALTGERPKNFPVCKPMIHHDINHDIPEGKRFFIKRCYFSWYFHVFCLIFNAMCCLGGFILNTETLVFIWSVVYLLVGFFITLWIYFFIYSGTRVGSSFRYVVWFIFFGIQVLFEICCAIGPPSFGSAGLVNMAEAFNSEQMVLGIFYAISAFLWTVISVFNVVLIYHGRNEYRQLGGLKAAASEVGKAAVQTAYDNRDTIKQVVIENKDTIKQVALDNKDVIIDIAKQNQDTIKQVAWENRDSIARVAVENKDVLFSNQSVVDDMFKK